MNFFKNPLHAFFRLSFFVLLYFASSSSLRAGHDLITLFPLDKYDQTVSHWINPSNPDFHKLLVSPHEQQKRMTEFYEKYLGVKSPWNKRYVTRILFQSVPDDLKTLTKVALRQFNNTNKTADQIGYGKNFHPFPTEWIKSIEDNIDLNQFINPRFEENNRGIAIDNLHARALPTEDPHFYDFKLAGEGYPFDNLQVSALWAGTPVYILGETRNRAWCLVLTADYIGWVKSKGIARVGNEFIHVWTKAAKDKLAAITHTQTSIVDDRGRFQFLAYVGSVFPVYSFKHELKIMIPVADADNKAKIKLATVSSNHASIMPLTATPHHFGEIMKTLIGRPYGWGNLYFYNDCTSEIKNLYVPFGIWLPRNSSEQSSLGKLVDLKKLSPEKRLAFIKDKGQPFFTLINVGGHILLYIGCYTNKDSVVMTYQNMWAFSPSPPSRRSVIGKAALFPLIPFYPEDKSLVSQLNKKVFLVSFLNELPVDESKQINMDLQNLMQPRSAGSRDIN